MKISALLLPVQPLALTSFAADSAKLAAILAPVGEQVGVATIPLGD